MCGALHVCWPTPDGVDGQYMICLLYRDFLCLAGASKVEQIYTLQAVILLNGTRVENIDNGRGECPAVFHLYLFRLTDSS